MSQLKTYCLLFISNDSHHCFTTDGSDRRLHIGGGGAISDFKWVIYDRVKNECCITGLPSDVYLFYCYMEDYIDNIPSEH